MSEDLASGNYTQAGWAGSIDDLKRIADAIEKQLAPYRTAAVAQARDEYAKTVKQVEAKGAEFGRPGGRIEEDIEVQYARSQLDDLERAYWIECTWNDGGIVRSTTSMAATVLDDVDPRTTTSVKLASPAGWRGRPMSITVELGPNRGAELSVRGSDHTWVRGTREVLARELQNSQQRHSWMRADWVGFTVGFLAAFALAWLAANILPDNHEYIGAVVWLVFISSAFATMGAIYYFTNPKRWPRFELVGSGQKQKSLIVRGFVLWSVSQVIFAVVIPLWIARWT